MARVAIGSESLREVSLAMVVDSQLTISTRRSWPRAKNITKGLLEDFPPPSFYPILTDCQTSSQSSEVVEIHPNTNEI